MPNEKKQKWMLTHDSHALKKGDIYEGIELPLWLSGKAVLVGDQELEVATPGELAKLQAELDAANGQVGTLTEEKAKLQAELDAATRQLAELQKKAK